MATTTQVQLALYKGPPSIQNTWEWFKHYAIRLWTWSRYSHAELVIGGMCYSSSSRDGGVRKRQIDLNSGRWDVVPILGADATAALIWFYAHEGQHYDWANIARFVMPFLPQNADQWVCFEAIGSMLNLAATHKLTANDLHDWAIRQSDVTAVHTTPRTA